MQEDLGSSPVWCSNDKRSLVDRYQSWGGKEVFLVKFYLIITYLFRVLQSMAKKQCNAPYLKITIGKDTELQSATLRKSPRMKIQWMLSED